MMNFKHDNKVSDYDMEFTIYHFSNDYYPSRDRYDPVRWEEDRCFIMKTLPDSLTDCHSIIRQDYRASLDIGIDDAAINLLPFCDGFQRVELDSENWKMYFSGYGNDISSEEYFSINQSSGRMTFREYLFDIMTLLGSCEAYIGFDPGTELKNIAHSKFPTFSYEDYLKGRDIPQFFRDSFDDCYARMEELRMLFPEYEVDSISLFGESILPVKKDGKIVLLNTKTHTLAFNDVADDYQMLNNKLYIASGNRIIVLNSDCEPVKEYRLKEWESSLLWE